jgi:hypothetical protein
MIVIRSGRHPHEVLILCACILWGVSGLVAYSRVATTSVRSMPVVAGYVFYAALVVFASVAVVGVFLPGLVGPRIEMSGLFALAGVAASYGVTVIGTAGWRGLSFALFMAALTVANLLRSVQIRHDERKLLHAAAATGSVDQLGAP